MSCLPYLWFAHQVNMLKMNVIRPSFSHWYPRKVAILLTALIALREHLPALVLVGLILQPLLRLSSAILLSSLIDIHKPSITIKRYSVSIVEWAVQGYFKRVKQLATDSSETEYKLCLSHIYLPCRAIPFTGPHWTLAPKPLRHIISSVLVSWKQPIHLML